MSIEPISSAMTYQAQQSPIVKPINKSETVDKDVVLQENTVEFDPSTAKIADAQGYDPNAQGKGAEDRQATQDQIRKAVEQLNKRMGNSEAVFGIHEGTNRVTIRLVDKETKETIKELPAEETLDMIAKVWEMAGILVDEKR